MSPRANAILRIPHEPGETVDAGPDHGYSDGTGETGLPPPAERHELDAFLADAFSDRSLMCAEVYDAEATPDAFRDDGTLFHDRLPSEDVDAFNPHVVGRAPILPPCAAELDEVPAWAYRTAGRA